MRVSSAQFLKEYGKLSDHALLEPITITRNGRDRLVLVSTTMFEELRNASIRTGATEALDDWEITAISQAEVPAKYAYLDALLDKDAL
jgi:hypothetical protein